MDPLRIEGPAFTEAGGGVKPSCARISPVIWILVPLVRFLHSVSLVSFIVLRPSWFLPYSPYLLHYYLFTNFLIDQVCFVSILGHKI